MKFFPDENFPRTAIAELEAAGHTARHALDDFPAGTPDDRLFTHARAEQAVFVSTDRDFFHTIPLAYPSHHGAIVITLRRANRESLLRRLADALATLGTRSLAGTVWLVTDQRIYARRKESSP